jgi:hypothetical protein
MGRNENIGLQHESGFGANRARERSRQILHAHRSKSGEADGGVESCYANWSDTSGFSRYPQVLEAPAARLLEALRSDTEGHASDTKTAERVAQLAQSSRELMQGLDRAKAETAAPDLVVTPPARRRGATLHRAARRAMTGTLQISGWGQLPTLMIHRRRDHYIQLISLHDHKPQATPPYAEVILKHFTRNGRSMIAPRFLKSDS